MKKIYYIIYQITNLINKKNYIGKHQTTNINDKYMGSSPHLKNAIKKYGIHNFNKEIIFECKNKDELIKKEQEIVNLDFIKRDDTYNQNLGGDGGWNFVNSKRSPEHGLRIWIKKDDKHKFIKK